MPEQEFEELVITAKFDKNNATRGIASLNKSLKQLQKIAEDMTPTISKSFNKIANAINNIHIDKKVIRDLDHVAKDLKTISKTNLKDTQKKVNQITSNRASATSQALNDLKRVDLGNLNLDQTQRFIDSVMTPQTEEIKLEVDQASFKSAYDAVKKEVEQLNEEFQKGMEGKGKYSGTQSYTNLNESQQELYTNINTLLAQINQKIIQWDGLEDQTTDAAQQLSLEINSQIGQAQQLTQGLTSVNARVEEIGVSATKSTKQLSKMAQRIKSLSFYRLFRMVFQYIINMAKQGLESIAQVDDGVNDAISSLKNNLNQTQSAIGATLGYAIESLEPILNSLLDVVNNVIDALSQMFAAMSGNTTYKKAIQTEEDYAESLERAKAAATGIDELNTLSNQETAAEDMYIDAEISEGWLALGNSLGVVMDVLNDIVKICSDLLSGDDFNGLLDTLAQILAVAMELVDQFLQSELFGFILESINTSLKNSMDTLNVILGVVEKLLGSIMDALKPIFNQLNNLFTSVLEPLTELLNNIFEPILEIVMTVLEGIVDLLGGMLMDDITIVTDALSGVVKIIQSVIDYVKDLGNIIKSVFNGDITGVFNSAKQMIVDIANFFIRVINTVVNIAQDVVNFFANIINTIAGWFGKDLNLGVEWNGIEELTIDSFATGGYVNEGQLFIANENGPELIGTMNGQTTVANNDQIVEGIKQGVIEAMQESGATNGGDVEVKVYLDSQEIAAKIKTNKGGATIYKEGV